MKSSSKRFLLFLMLATLIPDSLKISKSSFILFFLFTSTSIVVLSIEFILKFYMDGNFFVGWVKSKIKVSFFNFDNKIFIEVFSTILP